MASRRPFYTKRLQSNGYYPIDKWVWNGESGMYDRIPFKTKTPYHYAEPGMMRFVLENNPFLISESEFMDPKDGTHEGLPVVGQ